MRCFYSILLLSVVFSCKNNDLPKPSAMLRLEYSDATYYQTNFPLPFNFLQNSLSKTVDQIKFNKNKSTVGVNIKYPAQKATLHLTYKPVEDNLINLLKDTQNFTQKHTIKADEILSEFYENKESQVYGMLYEVNGNAASQAQFYLTDSIKHFLSGSLYFYAKPNYDSIYPAVEYLKKDVKKLIESLTWKY